MKIVLILTIILLVPFTILQGALPPSEFCVVVQEPVPVFSDPDPSRILAVQGTINRLIDKCGQVRTLEFIALPGTICAVHEILELQGATVYQITTNDYIASSSKKLYLDARATKRSDVQPSHRKAVVPEQSELVHKLESAAGLPYVWGGNVRNGVKTSTGKVFQGLDCSGLLYEATDGFTPRNTSELVTFGKPVKIAGLTSAMVAERLKPLDIIVWSGHVIIVLDGKRTIESRLECGKPGHGGVVIRPLAAVLGELSKTRSPLDEWPQDQAKGKKSFVVRRWYEGLDEGRR